VIRTWLLVPLALGPATAAAAPNPVNTTLTVPVAGDFALADPRDVVHLAGNARVKSIVTLGADELNIRLYIQLVDVRGVSSASGATCTASGGASRQVRLPATVQVPPQPTGPVSARVGVSCSDPAGDRPVRVGQPVFTFSLTFDEDGTLVEASALMQSAPGR
jgi:hypothetical protein